MIVVLTGAVHSGKTTLARELCRELEQRGSAVRGILSEAVFIHDSHEGYDAVVIGSEARFPLLRTCGEPTWERVGRYYLDPRGLAQACQAIEEHGLVRGTLFIDELGPLELKRRGGFWNRLSDLLFPPPGLNLVVVVREGLLSTFLDLFEKGSASPGNALSESSFSPSIHVIESGGSVPVGELADLLDPSSYGKHPEKK